MRQEAVPLNDINNSSTVHHLGHCDPGELLFGGYSWTFVKELQRCLAGYGTGQKKKKIQYLNMLRIFWWLSCWMELGTSHMIKKAISQWKEKENHVWITASHFGQTVW